MIAAAVAAGSAISGRSTCNDTRENCALVVGIAALPTTSA
jgi:hypothetical protein